MSLPERLSAYCLEVATRRTLAAWLIIHFSALQNQLTAAEASF